MWTSRFLLGVPPPSRQQVRERLGPARLWSPRISPSEASSVLTSVHRLASDRVLRGFRPGQVVSGFITPVRRVAGGINTGVAIRNVGTGEVNLNLSLRVDGLEVPAGSVAKAIPGNGQLVEFINSLLPDADTVNLVGSLVVTSDGMIAATGVTPIQWTVLGLGIKPWSCAFLHTGPVTDEQAKSVAGAGCKSLRCSRRRPIGPPVWFGNSSGQSARTPVWQRSSRTGHCRSSPRRTPSRVGTPARLQRRPNSMDVYWVP